MPSLDREAPSITKARARKLTAEARIQELALAKLEGELVTVADYERELLGLLERLRAALLGLPSKWAPTLVGCRSVQEAELRLEAAVRELMEALSRDSDRVSGDADGAGGDTRPAPRRGRGRPRGAATRPKALRQ